MRRSLILGLVSSLVAVAGPAEAQIAVSANDAKVLLVNGRVTVVPNPPPDTATILDLSVLPPRVIADVEVPTTVTGPPTSVAITPDEGLALVTAAQRIDPKDPTKQVPGDVLSVIDLKASPPRLIATLEVGRQPSGVSINRQGTLALVANRADGTVSIFTIRDKTVRPAGTLKVGDETSGASHVAITPDGKRALVTLDSANRIAVLAIDGNHVESTKHYMIAGVRPIAIDIARDGTFAVVANMSGQETGDSHTVSLIDLRGPPRVVDTISVGLGPEGVTVSPDGSVIAVVVFNGSNRPKESPFYSDAAKLVLLRATEGSLSRVAEARVGRWSQGVAFSSDGKTVVVGNMVEKDYSIFQWNGSALRDTGHRVKMKGGPAAIRTADK